MLMLNQTAQLKKARRWQLRSPSLLSSLFLVVVVLPTALGLIYFELFASDRYVAEAKFIVRSVNGRQGSSGLEALFRTFGVSRAQDDAFAVNNYIQSRDAVRELNEKNALRTIYGHPSADLFSKYPRFWRGDSFEALYEYYLQRIEVVYLDTMGITSLRVSAYTPQDSKLIAESLLHQSENLINRMNDRASADALAYAKDELDRAEEKVIASQREITRYRNSELLIDPSAVSRKALDLISSLVAELAQTHLQLNETIQKSPSSPTIQVLRVRIEALERQVAAENSKIAGGSDALASKIAIYERLVLDRDFADRNLALAFTTLETARQEARRQHLYIETVVHPLLPDEPTEPRRMRNIMTILLCSFAIFGMLWLVLAGSREHMHG